MRLGNVVGHRNVCRHTQLWLLKDRRAEAQDLRGLEMSVDHSAFHPCCERLPELNLQDLDAPSGIESTKQMWPVARVAWEILTQTAEYQAPTLPTICLRLPASARIVSDSYIICSKVPRLGLQYCLREPTVPSPNIKPSSPCHQHLLAPQYLRP